MFGPKFFLDMQGIMWYDVITMRSLQAYWQYKPPYIGDYNVTR